MAHADLTFSLMDADLVAGMTRAILALHQADGEGNCLDCLAEFPCATVRIIASTQDAAVARVADPSTEAWTKFMKRPVMPGEFPNAPHIPPLKTHNFKYPECPEFSGGICAIHHGQAVTGAA